MAIFETSGIDELMQCIDDLANVVSGAECPECGSTFDLKLDADMVTCPHCGVEIQIEHE